MPIVADILRSEASYLITFAGLSCNDLGRLAEQIAEAMRTFHGVTEVRVSASAGDLSLYVSIPRDVLPETLDAKAQALRDRWEREPRNTSLAVLAEREACAKVAEDAQWSAAGGEYRAGAALAHVPVNERAALQSAIAADIAATIRSRK